MILRFMAKEMKGQSYHFLTEGRRTEVSETQFEYTKFKLPTRHQMKV